VLPLICGGYITTLAHCDAVRGGSIHPICFGCSAPNASVFSQAGEGPRQIL